LSVTVHLPIIFNSSGRAKIEGYLPSNAKEYHYYFFNTSNFENTTTVSVYSSSSDIFVFDQSNNLIDSTLAKSGKEVVVKVKPNEMWKIATYSNESQQTHYTIDVYATAVNASPSSLDYETINSSFVSTDVILLSNLGTTPLTMNFSYYIFLIKEKETSGQSTLDFLVPSFTDRIEVWLDWNGTSNYTMSLYYPNGTLLTTTMRNYNNSILGLPSRLIINTTDVVEGTWKVEVSGGSDNYVLRSKIFLDLSWYTPNSTVIFLNSSSSSNKSAAINLNFSVPSTALSGMYMGNVIFYSSGHKVTIPVKFNLTTSELSVNGDFASTNVTVNENLGFNTTKKISVPLNNTGAYEVCISSHLNSSYLNHSSYYVEFDYEFPTCIQPMDSSTLNITLTIDSTKARGEGLYVGWIYLNATNESIEFTPHPYSYVNVTIILNLTDELSLEFVDPYVIGGDLINSSVDHNLTAFLQVFLINGTEIDYLEEENFTAWLKEIHTDHVISATNLRKNESYTNLYYNNKYNLEMTIPRNSIGGNYTLYIRATYFTGALTLSGTENWKPLLVYDTGLMFIAPTTLRVDEGSIAYFNATVINYGPKKASGNITFIGSCSYADISTSSKNVSAGTSGSNFTSIQLNGNGTAAWFSWKIDASGANITSDKTCYYTLSSTDASFNGSVAITIIIDNLSEEEEESQTQTQIPQEEMEETTTEAAEPKYLELTSYPTLIEIEQGESKETVVSVKNVNDTKSQQVTLSIEGINSTWYTITPSKVTISPSKIKDFKINFTIPVNAKMGEYSGKFVAKSSYKEVKKDFTLKVLPSEEKKKEINSTINELSKNVTALGDEIEKLEEEGYNVTLAQKEFSNLLQLLSQAKTALQNGDFLKAYQLIDDIKDALNSTREVIEDIKKTQKPGFLTRFKWVLIALASIAVGILIYLFWPEKEMGKNALQLKVQKLKKSKDEWVKLKEKWSRGKKWSVPQERTMLQKIKEKLREKK